LNNTPSTWPDPDYSYYRTFVLADGTFILVNFTNSACNDVEDGIPVCGYFEIDINGFKGPNIKGRDYFSFIMTKDKIIPQGSIGNVLPNYNTYCNPTSSNSSNGTSCASRVLKEGKMLY